jgi:predicted O-linked N-acetylglucosamine transferase (SPINDLY family)
MTPKPPPPPDLAAVFEAALGHHQQGRLAEAFAGYERILAAMPAHPSALHLSGVILHQSGRHEDAARRIQRAVRIAPDMVEAWSNLALVYQALHLPGEAVAALTEAARRAPDDAGVQANLAGALLEVGRSDVAAAAAQRAVELDARNPWAWFNLGLALQAAGRIAEALAAATRAHALAPDAVPPAGLRAQLEDRSGKSDAALQTVTAALRRHPDDVQLLFQLADTRERRREYAEAAAACAAVLRAQPEHGAALSQLLFLRKRLADWHDLGELRERFRAGVRRGLPQLSPFCLLSDPSTRAEQRRCAETWTATTAPSRAAAPSRVPAEGRLRIGYLSADFHTHATAFLAAGVFERHDRASFEVAAYSIGPDDGSPMRRRLEAAFDRFVDARHWSADRLAAQIRADGIDVLVDLKGHTDGAMPAVLALRPAPIQAQWLGYPGTMGASWPQTAARQPIVRWTLVAGS